MKFLHTSDWHLGHTLYNYDRTEEQQAFLHQLTEIVRTEQPDALLISGDVYHYSNPSAAVQRMYTDAMLAIHEACPTMQVVVTAGNHDSSSRLEIDSNLWNYFRVKVVGSIERKEQTVFWEKHLIPLTDSSGTLLGLVIAVPHCYPQNFPPLQPDAPREERQADFFRTLLEKVGQLNETEVPVVMMAHLALTGSDIAGHDETVGGMDYVPIDTIGNGYDYLALGHIHCPQNIRHTQSHARYSGSPLPVSFDETYPHSVTLVEIEKHGDTPKIRVLPIENPHPLITLPKEPAPFEKALQELADFPDDQPAYLRLNVLLKDYLSLDCNEQASNVMRSKAGKFCYIRTVRECQTGTEQTHKLNIQEMKRQSPIEIANRFYEETIGTPMDEALQKLMCSAYESVRTEETSRQNEKTSSSD